MRPFAAECRYVSFRPELNHRATYQRHPVESSECIRSTLRVPVKSRRMRTLPGLPVPTSAPYACRAFISDQGVDPSPGNRPSFREARNVTSSAPQQDPEGWCPASAKRTRPFWNVPIKTGWEFRVRRAANAFSNPPPTLRHAIRADDDLDGDESRHRNLEENSPRRSRTRQLGRTRCRHLPPPQICASGGHRQGRTLATALRGHYIGGSTKSTPQWRRSAAPPATKKEPALPANPGSNARYRWCSMEIQFCRMNRRNSRAPTQRSRGAATDSAEDLCPAGRKVSSRSASSTHSEPRHAVLPVRGLREALRRQGRVLRR